MSIRAKYYDVGYLKVFNDIILPSVDDVCKMFKIKLKFGDIVKLDLFDDRHTFSYIVSHDNKFIQNPDNSCSGYFTIPLEITEYLSDAIDYYSDLIDELKDEFYDIELCISDIIIRNIFTKPSALLELAKFSYNLIEKELIVSVAANYISFSLDVSQEEIEREFVKIL